MIRRIESLDHLRGLMAVAIMLFHYVSWATGELGSDTILGRLGIYGVSIFYILSGLSLAMVYRTRVQLLSDWLRFGVKRIFRIFPLFWLATSSAILLRYLAFCMDIKPEFGVTGLDAFLNYTLLFSFVEPGAYLTTGAWSIGNEIVFYTLFPLFILIACRSHRLFIAVVLMVFGAYVYCSMILLTPTESLAEQWELYINPVNQLLLFVIGVTFGVYCPSPQVGGSRVAITAFAAAAALFCLYPAAGDQCELFVIRLLQNRWLNLCDRA